MTFGPVSTATCFWPSPQPEIRPMVISITPVKVRIRAGINGQVFTIQASDMNV
jgi:hypothetical protein